MSDRSRLILVIAAAAFTTGASAAGPSTPMVSVVENSTDHIVLQYQFPLFETVSVELNGQRYVQVQLAGEGVNLTAGTPDVPHVARSVIIPDDGVMDATLTAGNYYEIPDMYVVPSKGNLLRTVDPATVPYTFDKRVYGTDAFFPGTLVALAEPYILRDFRGQAVTVYPIQYNPATHTLRVYTDMTVDIRKVSSGGENTLLRFRAHELTASFDRIYQAHFLNYEPETRYTPLDEDGDMLIICHDAWLPNIQPFVDHKNGIGINTTAVGVSTIPGGNNGTAIKNYIQSVYDSSNLAFVLLVGDSAQVATLNASGGSSDPSYSKVAGGDNYPDIMVGRFSAENSGQVDTQVQRSIEYEVNQATLQDWFWKGVGIGSDQGPGDDGEIDKVHIENIRQQLLAFGYTLVDQIYDPGASAAAVSAALNNGRGIINYCGHGSTTSWGTTGFSNSNIAALVNDNMLPFIVSVACVNGQFAGYTCFAEAWLRATHNGEPTGAIGCYMSSINQSWNPPMEAQDEFNILYTQIEANTYVSYGALCFAGSCSMMDEYGSDGANMFNTWHIFGDPSLRIVGTTAPPHGIAVSPAGGFTSQGNTGGPWLPASMDYTIENKNETPVDYAVTSDVNWLTLTNASGTLTGGGSVTITVSINGYANALPNGTHTGSLTFTNLTDHDGDATRPVQLTVGVPMPVLSFNLDANPGWAISGGQWAFGDPTGQGGGLHGYPDPQNGFTGTNVYGVNLNGDYSTTIGGPYYLTTTALDLSNTTQVSLRFKRWLNTDYQPYVSAKIEVSNNGTNWTQIWTNGSTTVAENAWSSQQYDVAAYANNQPTFYVRWSYAILQGGAYAYSGWNLDDIEIWGLTQAPNFPLGDLNCDGATDFGDINPFVMALTSPDQYVLTYPSCNIMLADISGNGSVGFEDINLFVVLLSR